MCWNPEVSLGTFLFASTIAVIAYHAGLFSFAHLLFLMSFISMQLVEFFLWTNLDDAAMNAIYSKIGYALILAQPAFVIMSMRQPRVDLLIGYAVLVAVILAVGPHDFRTTVGSNGHLRWNWLSTPIALLLIWLAFFCARFILQGEYRALSYILVTFGASYYAYRRHPGTWGTMWCWAANGTAFYYLYRLLG
jgi:hypothetical protein